MKKFLLVLGISGLISYLFTSHYLLLFSLTSLGYMNKTREFFLFRPPFTWMPTVAVLAILIAFSFRTSKKRIGDRHVKESIGLAALLWTAGLLVYLSLDYFMLRANATWLFLLLMTAVLTFRIVHPRALWEIGLDRNEKHHYDYLLSECLTAYIEECPDIRPYCSENEVKRMVRTVVRRRLDPFYHANDDDVKAAIRRIGRYARVKNRYEKESDTVKRMWPRRAFLKKLELAFPSDPLAKPSQDGQEAWFMKELDRLRSLEQRASRPKLTYQPPQPQENLEAQRLRGERDALADPLKRRLAEVQELIQEAQSSGGRFRNPLLKQLKAEETELLRALKNA